MFILVTCKAGEIDAQKIDNYDKAIDCLKMEYNSVINDNEYIEEAFFDKGERFYVRNQFDEEYVGKLIQI